MAPRFREVWRGGTSRSNIPKRSREEIRAEILELVKQVVPEELDQVDEMMDQFHGRENELLETLVTMQQRAAAQRTRQGINIVRRCLEVRRGGTGKSNVPKRSREEIHAAAQRIRHGTIAMVDATNAMLAGPDTGDGTAALTITRKDLYSAMDVGDWGAVKAIAAALAMQSDSESYSDCSEAGSATSSEDTIDQDTADLVHELDKVRAFKLDQFVESDDWEGVVRLTSSFEANNAGMAVSTPPTHTGRAVSTPPTNNVWSRPPTNNVGSRPPTNNNVGSPTNNNVGSQPTNNVGSPKNNVGLLPKNNVGSRPPTICVGSQPTNNFRSPTNFVESRPPANYVESRSPTNNVGSPTKNVGSQPTNNVASPPTNNVESPTNINLGLQPTKNGGSRPLTNNVGAPTNINLGLQPTNVGSRPPTNYVGSHPSTNNLASTPITSWQLQIDTREKMDYLLDEVKCVRSSMNDVMSSLNDVKLQVQRISGALAWVASETLRQCPSLVWMVPATARAGTTGSQWIRWAKAVNRVNPNNFVARKYHVYFVCQHDLEVVKPPLEILVTRNWVKRAAPLLKLSLIAIKMAMRAYNLPFPVCDLALSEQLTINEEFITSFLGGSEKVLSDLDTAISENPFKYTTNREPMHHLAGDAYKAIAEYALKDDNSEWRKSMVLVFDSQSTPMWVKKEHAHHYL